MAFAIEGFSSYSQNYIGKGINSNFYPKAVFIAILGALSLGNNDKQPLQIGRPGKMEILAGGKLVSPAEKLDPEAAGFGANGYAPRSQLFETQNSKWMGRYDTAPTVSSATTLAQSQAMQGAALFRPAEVMTPGLIWHRDKERAGQRGSSDGRAIAMAQILEEATEVAYQEHVNNINWGIWFGNPSSQAVDPWDQPLGLVQAFSRTNVYGNVDRAVAANTALWGAGTDSTITSPDIIKLLDEANLNTSASTSRIGLNIFGEGASFALCGIANYVSFKNQILSSGGGGVILQNGIPQFASIGVKKEVLQKDNCYVMFDPMIAATPPGKNISGYTVPASFQKYVFFFSAKTWRLAFHPQKNMTVTPFRDLSLYQEGGKEADQFFIDTQLVFSSDNPGQNVVFSTIG